jgi:general secretion pathway protein J
MAARVPLRRPSGFTLIEVLVALTILAIMSAMAFRGIDALMRAKDAAMTTTDRTLKLNTGMSQFEYDVSQIVNSKVLPSPVMFDGATLRVARRTPDGVQLVLWTLQDRRWQRWASGSVVHMSELTDAWMRSQQWDAVSGNAVSVLENVDSFQVYLCNPSSLAVTGCSWNNVQSTQGAATTPEVTGQAAPVVAQSNAIRIQLKVGDGEITREKELPRW